MTLTIPGLGTLYAILKRDIEVGNQRLEYRRTLAAELYQNCEDWSRLLVTTFDRAVERWARNDYNGAAKEIMDLQNDFLQLDYRSIRTGSPIIEHLSTDPRFRTFAEACCAFYESALSVKRMVYGEIQDSRGRYVRADMGAHIGRMESLWRQEVERMLEMIGREWHQIRTLEVK